MTMEELREDTEGYLNEIGRDLDKENFIIGGRFRWEFFPDHYGTALKIHGPVTFNQAVNERMQETN